MVRMLNLALYIIKLDEPPMRSAIVVTRVNFQAKCKLLVGSAEPLLESTKEKSFARCFSFVTMNKKQSWFDQTSRRASLSYITLSCVMHDERLVELNILKFKIDDRSHGSL